MAFENQVIVDGMEPQRPRRRRDSSKGFLLAGGLMGLVLVGLVVVFTGDRQVDTSATTEVLAASEPTLPRFGVTSVVPDFPDAMVGIAAVAADDEEDSIGLKHVLWPANAEEVVRPLADGVTGPSSFDSSGTWLALSRVTDDGLELSTGKLGGIQPTATAVTSFAWHDSTPGWISFTLLEESEWHLSTAVGMAPARPVESRFIRSGEGVGLTVAAWGDWGWALQRADDRPVTLVLGPDGEAIGSVPGWILGSHRAGKIVVAEESEVSVLDVSDFSVLMRWTGSTIGAILDATFSPDGERVAILGDESLVVRHLDDDGGVGVFKPIVGFPQAAWSSDSRFVLVPGPTGISVLDTVANTSAEALAGHEIQAVGVISLPGS